MGDLGWSTETDWSNTQSSSNVSTDGGSFSLAKSLPETIASRPNDNRSSDVTTREGAEINPNDDFAAMGAELSSNTTGVTRAYAYDLTDNSLIAETDISGISSGGVFTLDANFYADTPYSIVVDAEGSSYTLGWYDDTNYPYTSSDVDYTGGIKDATSASPNGKTIVSVGDLGF